MFGSRDPGKDTQPQFWIDARKLPKATAGTFYRKLDATLEKIGFTQGVRDLCRPAYADASKGGRPGIDPAVYFKMLMIGFFENLPSERAIASRCADSLSLRALHGHGLLKGRHLGIDSSVIEANAFLRELVHRNTEEQYREYVKRLAAQAGIGPDDTKAVRRFDKKRKGRKTSNYEWANPHDPDANVGMTKHGACDMIYKPEHTVDLESSAAAAATVRLCNEGDTKELTERILAAGQTLARVCDDPHQAKVLQSLTADEGYFAVEEICGLQGERIRTIIEDPHAAKRRKEKEDGTMKRVLSKAERAVKSKSGKALLKKRGEHIERSFAHVLDQGGMRRATLRGAVNLTERHLAAVLAYDLSLLMRKLTGHGTPKQWLAAAYGAF